MPSSTPDAYRCNRARGCGVARRLRINGGSSGVRQKTLYFVCFELFDGLEETNVPSYPCAIKRYTVSVSLQLTALRESDGFLVGLSPEDGITSVCPGI